MADIDTAVLEPETLTTEDAAPLEETAAESDQVEETEEENAETTAVSDEEIQARIDAAVQAEREETEAKLSRERYQREITEAVRYRQQAGVQAVGNFAAWVADRVENGASKAEVMQMMNPQVVNSLAAQLESMAATEQWALAGENFDSFMKKEYPEWKPSTDLVKSYERALSSKDPGRMFNARWEFQKAALLETEVQKRVETLAKEALAKGKSAAQVAAVKAGDSAKANAPRPTNTNGSAASSNGIMTSAQIEAMPTSEWLNLPQERRDFLRANRAIADERASKRR